MLVCHLHCCRCRGNIINIAINVTAIMELPSWGEGNLPKTNKHICKVVMFKNVGNKIHLRKHSQIELYF